MPLRLVADSVGELLGFRGPGSSGAVNGESALLIIVSGGGAGRPARPIANPETVNPKAVTNSGKNRSLRNRRAQSSQNLRLVQRCQRRRRSLVPHSAQKLGRYIQQRSEVNNSEVRSQKSEVRGQKSVWREESAMSRFYVRLTDLFATLFLLRSNSKHAGCVRKWLAVGRESPVCPIAKNLACRDTRSLRQNYFSDEFIFS